MENDVYSYKKREYAKKELELLRESYSADNRLYKSFSEALTAGLLSEMTVGSVVSSLVDTKDQLSCWLMTLVLGGLAASILGGCLVKKGIAKHEMNKIDKIIYLKKYFTNN